MDKYISSVPGLGHIKKVGDRGYHSENEGDYEADLSVPQSKGLKEYMKHGNEEYSDYAKQHMGDIDDAQLNLDDDHSSQSHQFGSEGEHEVDYNEKQTGSKRGSALRYSKLNPFEQKVMVSDQEPIGLQRQSIENLKSHPWKHLIFGPMVAESIFKKHLILTYRGLVYARKCLKGPSDKFIQSKQVQMNNPKVVKGYTLLLDLDETLIHTCSLKENPEHIFTVKSDMGAQTKVQNNNLYKILDWIENQTIL